MALEEVDFEFLWSKNCKRAWVQFLQQAWESGQGKDFATIDHWIYEFCNGGTSTLRTDRDYTITDGHHRLVAGKLVGITSVCVVVCPQKSTYGN